MSSLVERVPESGTGVLQSSSVRTRRPGDWLLPEQHPENTWMGTRPAQNAENVIATVEARERTENRERSSVMVNQEWALTHPDGVQGLKEQLWWGNTVPKSRVPRVSPWSLPDPTGEFTKNINDQLEPLFTGYEFWKRYRKQLAAVQYENRDLLSSQLPWQEGGLGWSHDWRRGERVPWQLLAPKYGLQRVAKAKPDTDQVVKGWIQPPSMRFQRDKRL